MKKSLIYTKTGDDGTTSLVGGKRVHKADARLEAYGTIDELNSHIGLLLAEELPEEVVKLLTLVQHRLFTIGSNLATDPSDTEYIKYSLIEPSAVERLEHAIDTMDSQLPKMTGFILPAGGRSASQCHVCRTVCRRAERRIYALREVSEVDSLIVKYINRLSDYFFVLARSEAFRVHGKEVTWNKECN